MGNEMGNNNVSGIKEENAAVEVLEKAQESVPVDEVKGENHVIPEEQSNDFQAKEESSSNDQLDADDSVTERLESNEKDIGGEEPKNDSKSPKAATESNDSNSHDRDIQKSALPDEGSYEKPLEPNMEENIISSSEILQINDQPSTPKEIDAKEVETSDLQPSKSLHHPTTSLEDSQCLLSNQSEEVPKMSETRNLDQEKEYDEKFVNREGNIEVSVPEESGIVEDELLETKTGSEKCETKSSEDKFEDVLEKQGDDQVPLRMNLSECSDLSTEASLQFSSLDPTPEPQEERIIQAEMIGMLACESEKAENKEDSNAINSSKQPVDELVVNNPAPSVILQDTSKENGEEAVFQLGSKSGFEKADNTGQVKVTHRRSKSALAGRKRSISIEQFEFSKEVIKMLPRIPSISTGLSYVEKNDKEKREEISFSSVMNNNDRGGAEKERILGSESFKLENDLLETSSTQESISQNGNYETLLESDASEDRKKCTEIDLQKIFINEISNPDANNETTQIPASSTSSDSFKQEPADDIQTTPGTSLQTEVLTNRSNEKNTSSELSQLPNGNHQQRGKSPSFDFGLQIDTRAEESDQTPLLHHDKTSARSFSGLSNVRFQNRIIQTDYGRNSLNFEAVSVEEKTIRMERSDSDISRASFMKLLKKDDELSSPEKQEIPDNNNSEDISTEELALTISPKESGKRKLRPSFFTSCICCTASIH